MVFIRTCVRFQALLQSFSADPFANAVALASKMRAFVAVVADAASVRDVLQHNKNYFPNKLKYYYPNSSKQTLAASATGELLLSQQSLTACRLIN